MPSRRFGQTTTPVLLCARCGGPMHGEAYSRSGRLHRYYGCHASRRNRSAVHPSGPRCDARLIESEALEEGIHYELARCLPSDQMHAELRRRLRTATGPRLRSRQPEVAIRRLEEQLTRARRLYEFGEYDWDTFEARRDEIQEQLRQLKKANSREQPDLEWCGSQLLDLMAAWETADAGQRSRLVAGIFDQLEAEVLPEGRIRVVAVPRPAWRPFFECLVLERETGFEPSSANHGIEFVYRISG